MNAALFISARIQSLFRDGSPPTVCRAVRTININPVNSSSRWPCSHVRIEILKPLPPVTHGDSSTSVMAIANIPRILAALYHRTPTIVSRRVGHPVCSIPKPSVFIFQATATERFAAFEVSARHHLFSTAPTNTSPNKSSAPNEFNSLGAMEYQEPSKGFAAEVYESWAAWFKMVGSHVVSSVSNVVRAVGGNDPIGGSLILARVT